MALESVLPISYSYTSSASSTKALLQYSGSKKGATIASMSMSVASDVKSNRPNRLTWNQANQRDAAQCLDGVHRLAFGVFSRPFLRQGLLRDGVHYNQTQNSWMDPQKPAHPRDRVLALTNFYLFGALGKNSQIPSFLHRDWVLT